MRCSRDTIEFQRRGIPTVSVVSSEFVGLFRTMSKAQGFDDLPIVVVPHPWVLLTAPELVRLADEKFEEIVFQATAHE